MINRRQTLKRSSILKHKTEIESLFANGKKKQFDFIRLIYKPDETDIPNQDIVRIFVAVPKKYIHHASDRNLIKRRLRECIRKNLPELKIFCEEKKIHLDLGFVYQVPVIHKYSEIEQIIILSLQKIYSTLL